MKTKLDKYHYHEALDRCHLVGKVFEGQVIDHHGVLCINAKLFA